MALIRRTIHSYFLTQPRDAVNQFNPCVTNNGKTHHELYPL